MTAKYWTTDGNDIWVMTERRVFEFKNLETRDVVTCDCVSEVKEEGLVPVKMPKVKVKTEKVKTEKVKTAETSTWGKKSQYKGVTPVGTKGKFRACFWDKGENKYLGTFDSELLAAAAYQEHIGCHQEARRLTNEHQEGDPNPTEN